MTFKVKRKKKLPETYFREREIKILKKRYKGDIPISQLIKAGHRVAIRYPRKTHRVNQLVIYKGKEYIVRKVSRKGVYLSTLKRENGLIDKTKLGKPKFIPEKKYSGKAVPVEAQYILAPA